MQINKINLNNICFRQNSSSGANVSLEKPTDSFEQQKPIEPSKMNDWQLIFNTISDEQIEQINKSKKLPEKYKFLYVNTQLPRQGAPWQEPYYTIIHPLPFIKKGTSTLPEGYKVQKNKYGKLEVVKINKS